MWNRKKLNVVKYNWIERFSYTYGIKSSWEDVKSHPLTDGSGSCRTWVREWSCLLTAGNRGVRLWVI